MKLNEELVRAAAKAAQDASPYLDWDELGVQAKEDSLRKARNAIAHYLENRSDSDLAREAADTLVKASRRYYGARSLPIEDPELIDWRPANLRHAADGWDDDEAAGRKRDDLVAEIRSDLLRGLIAMVSNDDAAAAGTMARELVDKFDIKRREGK